MTTGIKYAGIRHKQDGLLRKSLDGGVSLAPYSATALTVATLFATDGNLLALPTGYNDLGFLTADGVKFTRTVKTSEVASWGSVNPTRVDITSDEVSCQFVCQETNIHTIALAAGVLESTITTTPSATGAIEIDKPALPAGLYYRLAVFGIDSDSGGETAIVRFMPRAKITDYADSTFADGDDPLTRGFTFTAFFDDTLGYSEAAFFGGAAWLANLTAAGFTLG